MNNQTRFGTIYEIKNVENNKRYIGSTIDLKSRRAAHFNFLRHNKHRSILLQNAFNKYGEKSFVFSVIEDNVIQDCLIEREQYWIDKLHPEYNVAKVAGSPMLGRTCSPETRKKMSMARMGCIVSEETRKKHSVSITGHIHSLETRAKMSAVCSR